MRLYHYVKVNGETFSGEQIEKVFYPDKDEPYWVIDLKDGSVICTTAPVVVKYEDVFVKDDKDGTIR